MLMRAVGLSFAVYDTPVAGYDGDCYIYASQ